MPSLQELEAPIEKRIADALIEATPECWCAARLEVSIREEDGVVGMPHTISSPEGRREVVAPTDEIMAATFELRELFRQHGRSWRRLVFDVTSEGEAWRYVARYAY